MNKQITKIGKLVTVIMLILIFLELTNIWVQGGSFIKLQNDTLRANQDNKILDSYDNIYTSIIGLILLIGGIIYVSVTKGKILYEFILKILKKKQKMDEAVFYDNHETIIEYLTSKKVDQYNTAFTYILHHNEFPNKVIKVLMKIILKEKPFDNLAWVDDEEKVRAGQHLCFVLKKNNQKLNGRLRAQFCNVENLLKSNSK